MYTVFLDFCSFVLTIDLIQAHCNPLSHNNGFDYPACPEEIDWKKHYPLIEPDRTCPVNFLDIGMGFGGMTLALAEQFPDKFVLGMEIRAKVLVVMIMSLGKLIVW